MNPQDHGVFANPGPQYTGWIYNGSTLSAPSISGRSRLIPGLEKTGPVAIQAAELTVSTHQRHTLPRTRRPEAAGRICTEAPEGVPAAVGAQVGGTQGD